MAQWEFERLLSMGICFLSRLNNTKCSEFLMTNGMGFLRNFLPISDIQNFPIYGETQHMFLLACSNKTRCSHFFRFRPISIIISIIPVTRVNLDHLHSVAQSTLDRTMQYLNHYYHKPP